MKRELLLWSILFCVPPMCRTLPAAPATRPATNPSITALDKQILELIAVLDAPDVSLREKATAKLIALGPRVLKPLREALTPDSSPEFTARAKDVLAEITSQWRYVDETGGNVVGGFQAVLGGKAEFPAGKPISLVLLFRCVGSTGGVLMETRTVDIELVDSAAVFTAPQSEGRLVVKKVGNTRPPDRATPLLCNSGEPHAIEFNVGGSVNTSLWIDGQLLLAPGDYELRFIYYAQSKALLKDALEDLESNALKIRVTAAAP